MTRPSATRRWIPALAVFILVALGTAYTLANWPETRQIYCDAFDTYDIETGDYISPPPNAVERGPGCWELR